MKKPLLLLLSVCCTTQFLTAQNVGINATGASPDGSAILDVSSTTSGQLTPRMTTAQRDNIGSPAEGLLIYSTDCKSFNFYNGTAWVSMSGSSSLANPGTITGNTNVCSGATGEVYSITAVTGATDYVWTIPTGATITAGQGTTSITVTFGANSGDICVQASDACFTSNTSCNSITVGTALNLNQLVAYYKFNEASGNIINEATNVGSVDAIPNSNLTVAGATYGATGQLGNALSFDGVNDHADANGSLITDWNFLHQNNAAWTIAFWVQYDNFTTPNDLFATTNGNTGDVGLVIRTRADRTILVSSGQGGVDLFLESTAALVPNNTNWHFIAITFEDDQACRVRINGSAFEALAAPTLTNTANPETKLGVGYDTDAIWHAGDLDEVSIWNRVLSDCEIEEIYNNGLGVDL